MNKYNLFNQVGLIALNCIGEFLDPHANLGMPLGLPTKPGSTQSELNLIDEMKFDNQTVDKLKQLIVAKQKAVEIEDFEEAKRIKETIERIKQSGYQITQLEERKKIAVEQEDQDTAKMIKKEIDRLRSGFFIGQQNSNNNNQMMPMNQLLRPSNLATPNTSNIQNSGQKMTPLHTQNNG